MTLLDLEEYIKVKDRAFADYEDRKEWHKKMLVNIAKAGFFSSDRTIAQYDSDIWHTKAAEDTKEKKETAKAKKTVVKAAKKGKK